MLFSIAHAVECGKRRQRFYSDFHARDDANPRVAPCNREGPNKCPIFHEAEERDILGRIGRRSAQCPHQVINWVRQNHRGLPEQLGSYVSGKSAGVEEAQTARTMRAKRSEMSAGNELRNCYRSSQKGKGACDIAF